MARVKYSKGTYIFEKYEVYSPKGFSQREMDAYIRKCGKLIRYIPR